MRNVMGKEEKKASVSELRRRLVFQNYYGNYIRDQELDAKAIDWV
jgi:hypothetical protein